MRWGGWALCPILPRGHGNIAPYQGNVWVVSLLCFGWIVSIACTLLLWGLMPSLVIGAALENFLLENPKTFFPSTYTTRIGQAGRAKCGFSQLPPSPISSYFIEHHIHQNWPLWQRIHNEYTTRSWHWQCSGMGASLMRATASSKLQGFNSQQRKTAHILNLCTIFVVDVKVVLYLWVVCVSHLAS